MGKLSNIANKHTADKGTQHYEKHGYTEVYDKYIPETGEFVLLEIGIWHGDSLRMWREYNPELIIHGVDIDPNVHNYITSSDKTTVYIGDQSNRNFMEAVVTASGTPDFIIDDGSHNHEHIVASFKILWDHLKPGGYYFIEDLHAAHAQRDKTIKDIIDWLISNERKYTSMESFCNNKLLILQK